MYLIVGNESEKRKKDQQKSEYKLVFIIACIVTAIIALLYVFLTP